MKKLFIILLLFVFFVPAYTNAQLFDNLDNINLKSTPNFPEPLQEVTVLLDAYSYDTSGAKISWFLDGIEQTEAKDIRKITFRVGMLNEPIRLTVNILLKNGQTLSSSRIFIPSRVDIVIESDTLVPIFYKGRAMPSSGSSIRAIALIDTTANTNTLTYTWKLNNKVLYGGPLVGKNIAEIEAPQGGRSILSVSISDRIGIQLVKKTIEIRVTKPHIAFYEDNPLRGLSRNAIQSPYILTGDEVTVRAEPYFMSSGIFASNPLIEWQVNRNPIDNPNDDPQVVTLRGGGGSGNFLVNFHIRNLENLLQGVKKDFIVSF